MVKKCLSLVLTLCCLSIVLCSCGGNADTASSNNGSSCETVSDMNDPREGKYINNLTGVYELTSKDKVSARPVAVMINNIRVAQKVQTGLLGASVVYETFAEGGITRLMAVFKDVDAIPQLGSLRSARYSYVDLACGHDALYVHVGGDPVYCKQHMADLLLDDFDLQAGYASNSAYRVKNGLAYEHTMFTTGEKLAAGIRGADRRLTVDDNHADLWLNFADQDTRVVPKGGSTANRVSVYFSGSYVSNFDYDESGVYYKSNLSDACIDADTGNQCGYKNLFVLFTTVGMFDDNYRVYSELKNGDGYYFTNGSYQPITWKKGGTYDTLKFFDGDGKELTVSAGNSYVCITNKNYREKVTIE